VAESIPCEIQRHDAAFYQSEQHPVYRWRQNAQLPSASTPLASANAGRYPEAWTSQPRRAVTPKAAETAIRRATAVSRQGFRYPRSSSRPVIPCAKIAATLNMAMMAPISPVRAPRA